MVPISMSLLGKYLFLLRFSRVLLGAVKWEISWRSQVPSEHICKRPPGFRLPLKPSCSQQWKSWLLPGLRNTGKQLERGM